MPRIIFLSLMFLVLTPFEHSYARIDGGEPGDYQTDDPVLMSGDKGDEYEKEREIRKTMEKEQKRQKEEKIHQIVKDHDWWLEEQDKSNLVFKENCPTIHYQMSHLQNSAIFRIHKNSNRFSDIKSR